MANFEIPGNPEYTEAVRKFEEEDPGHADLFNDVVQALLNNEVFLKKMADTLANRISGLNTLTRYTTTQTPNPTVGEQITQVESMDFDLETGNPIPFPIQTVIEGHERTLRKLNTDMGRLFTGKAISNIDERGIFEATVPPGYNYAIAQIYGLWGEAMVKNVHLSGTTLIVSTNIRAVTQNVSIAYLLFK